MSWNADKKYFEERDSRIKKSRDEVIQEEADKLRMEASLGDVLDALGNRGEPFEAEFLYAIRHTDDATRIGQNVIDAVNKYCSNVADKEYDRRIK